MACPSRFDDACGSGDYRVAMSDGATGGQTTSGHEKPLLRRIDAVLVRVPDIDEGLAFYRDRLGMQLRWRRDGSAAVRLGDSELVLTTELDPETDLLVDSVSEAVGVFSEAGGSVLVGPQDIPVGKVAVVEDPFGNRLTIVDLSKGTYLTDGSGTVTGLADPMP